MIWRSEGIFPTLFLSYFSDILTMIMTTSESAIFLFISASLTVCINYSCVIHVIYMEKRARLLSSYARLPPFILRSFLSISDYPDPIIVLLFIQNNF